MAHTEDRMIAAMIRIQASEKGWEGHMFVLPTDSRISAAARQHRPGGRVIEDDEVILMCRGGSCEETPTATQKTALDWDSLVTAFTTIRGRTEAAIAAASDGAQQTRVIANRSKAVREDYAAARAKRMRRGLSLA